MKSKNSKMAVRGHFGSSAVLGVIYRDVIIREKITSDGVRRCLYGWQVYHDASGRELSSENACRMAKCWLPKTREIHIFGYPDRQSLDAVFGEWPETDNLHKWSKIPSYYQDCPKRIQPRRALGVIYAHRKLIPRILENLLELFRSYKRSAMTPNDPKLSHAARQKPQK